MFGIFGIQISWEFLVEKSFLTKMLVIGRVITNNKIPESIRQSESYYGQIKTQLVQKSIQIIDLASKYEGVIFEVKEPNIIKSDDIVVSFYLIFKDVNCLNNFIKAYNKS